MRQDYNYEGLKMELDETSYEWGTCYEIEIETVCSDLWHSTQIHTPPTQCHTTEVHVLHVTQHLLIRGDQVAVRMCISLVFNQKSRQRVWSDDCRVSILGLALLSRPD